MTCPNYEDFKQFILGFNQTVEIDKNKEKETRYNVWGTTSEQVTLMIRKNSLEPLADKNPSPHIIRKLNGSLTRLSGYYKKAESFLKDVIDDKNNIEMSIALYEVMESVKGEADKARNNSVNIQDIAPNGNLPNLPLSRIAASIGRKIAYQHGHRFKADKVNQDTAAKVEKLYFDTGMKALNLLEQKGYIKFYDNAQSIKDYINIEDINKKYSKEKSILTKDVKTVALNESFLNIQKDKKGNSPVLDYFLNRSDANIEDTELEVITEVLRAIRQITQPSNIVLPDTTINPDKEFMDQGINRLPQEFENARKKIYETPIYVHESVHSLMEALYATTTNTGRSAIEEIKTIIGNKPGLINSLFGIKQSDDYSIDKKESIGGQNLSRTTPLNDLVDYYGALTKNGERSALHMALKIGRNGRLYYENSILNPHASKQSRYMLTGGKQTIEYGSEDFDYLVAGIGQALDKKLTYNELLGTDQHKALEAALTYFDNYQKSKDLKDKLHALTYIAHSFPGVDYVSLLTTLKAVQDIRNPSNGNVTTEFMVSADATASGGTLTFMQALGTSENVTEFLQRIGILTGGDSKNKLNDLYGLLTEAITGFIEGKHTNTLAAPDLGTSYSQEEQKTLLKNTIKFLFDDLGDSTRDLSKDPTMTFVYGQGEPNAIKNMANSLANRIFDNLGNPSVQQYMALILNSKDYKKARSNNFIHEKGLHKKLVTALIDKGLPKQLFDLMDDTINKKYLSVFKDRSVRLSKLLNKIPNDVVIKILPAAAVLNGSIGTRKEELDDYGIPLSKVYEVASVVDGETVLTRKEKIQKTVMDVSPIHSIDASQLYRSIDQAMGKQGVIVVHDDVRGNVQTVRAMEKAYNSETKKVTYEYDIHEQVLKAIAVYAPEIADTQEYRQLQKEIEGHIVKKQEILSQNFEKETRSIIGDGDYFKKFAENAKRPEQKNNSATLDIEIMLETLKGESSIISEFLAMSSKVRSKVVKGTKNEFRPQEDTIALIGMKTGSRTKQIEAIEHEITHANTVAYLQEVITTPSMVADNRSVMYFQKAIAKMRTGQFSGRVQQRVNYILEQKSTLEQVAEFVAIMHTEKTVAANVYRFLDNKKTITAKIKEFVTKAFNRLTTLSAEDLSKEIDIEKLYNAITQTVKTGTANRETDYASTEQQLKNITVNFQAGLRASVKDKLKSEASIRYLNYAVSSMLSKPAISVGKTAGKYLHNELKKKFPIYTDVVNKLQEIYDGSEAFPQIMHTITGAGIDKVKKADILALFQKVSSERNTTITIELDKFHTEIKKLSKEQMSDMYNFVHKVPLHDYFVLAHELTTASQIDTEISKLEKTLKKNNPEFLRNINSLVALQYWDNTTALPGNVYNLEQFNPGGEVGNDLKKLLALKSIQKIGSSRFEDFLKNTSLMELVKDHSVANSLSLIKNKGVSELRDNLIKETYKEPFELRAIEKDQLKHYEYESKNGWKILRMPTEDTLGIVYQPIIDSSASLMGAFTDIKLISTDINVFGKKASYRNVVQMGDRGKLILTDQEKDTLGVVKDFSQSLVRDTAHNMAIQESQIIRDELVKQETLATVDSKAPADLIRTLEATNKDNPWFIKLEGVSYSELDERIKAKYMPVGERASNVQDFDKKVDLVRKDISHWLLGGHAKSLANNPKMKWAIRIVKDLITGSKIGMVVVNPLKIAKDNVSNISYLTAMGASPLFIAKQYKTIAEDFSTYMDLLNQLTQLKVSSVANPESTKLQKQIKSLEDRVKKNNLSGISERGFINSLGSSLVSRNADTLSGFQADAHKALEYLLINKKGNKNLLSHFILQLSKVGYKGEDFIKLLGTMSGKVKAGSIVNKELDQVVERLKDIRSEEDIINYVAQFTNSPGSEAVRFGSEMTDLTDVLAKETLYRHLILNENMKPEDARIKVLDSFPDYKENMPLAIQRLSDMGIIMFPSFWLRIQKVIYRLAKDKPVNLASELLLEEVTGANIENIVSANIINKSNTWGGLVHSPFETLGINSLFPTHFL